MTEQAPRPEYARLARDFVRLAHEAGLHVDDVARRDVATFAAAIEWVDRVMDAVPLREERVRFGRRALAAACGEDRVHSTLDALAETLVRRDVVAPFARLVEEELVVGETMRHATDSRTFLECVAREGALTTEMTLLVSGLSDPRFRRFFRSLGEPANLVDKLLDARADHARGEMRLRPTWRLHARIALEILRRVPRVVVASPRPVWVLVWGFGYCRTPIGFS
jgi:hypothetical protein